MAARHFSASGPTRFNPSVDPYQMAGAITGAIVGNLTNGQTTAEVPIIIEEEPPSMLPWVLGGLAVIGAGAAVFFAMKNS